MSEDLDPRSDIPTFLAAGHASAEAERWVEAAAAWINAAILGSPEGADLARRVAPQHLKPLADDGDVEAQSLLAEILMDKPTPETVPMAVDYARRAAEAGHATGLRHLGLIYGSGLGVAADRSRAVELLQQAAANGDGRAALLVAGLDAGGKQPMSLTHDECIRLLDKGVVSTVLAQQGVVIADRLMVAQRDEEALKWYVWAAEHGNEGAKETVAAMRDNLSQ